MKTERVLMKDVIVKKLFTNEVVGKEYTSFIISKLLNIPYKDVLNNIEVVTEEIANTSKTVNSRADAVFKYNDKSYIDIEVNYSEGENTNAKNVAYVCHLYLRELPNWEEYNNLKPVIQINIDNYDYFGKDEFIYECVMTDKKTKLIEHENIISYHINIPKLERLSYNEIKKDELKKIFYMFVCNDEEKLNKMYKGDKLMSRVRKQSKIISDGLNISLYFDDEEIKRLNRIDAINEGIEVGAKEEKISIAKKLINLNVDKNTIISATGLTSKQLEEIIKNEK